jgi:hypothetical protein
VSRTVSPTRHRDELILVGVGSPGRARADTFGVNA